MAPYAIVETGGKQYRAEPGKTITVEKLSAGEGSTIELDRVLMVSDDTTATIGKPTVEGAKVVAEVATQARGDKIIVFKYKPKTRYSVKTGHRQALTRLAIKELVTGEGAKKAPVRRRPRKAATDGA